VPPVLTPAGTEHHVGKAILMQLVTPDLVASKKFYGGLFGWTWRDMVGRGMQYAEAANDGQPVAAFIQKEMPKAERRQPSWLAFVAVRDVDAASRIAVERGAKMLSGPADFPKRGRQAVLTDPQGAVFALLASSSGDPPDELADPGEWIWSALIASDPDRAAAFYQALFDYDVFEAPTADDSEHAILATEDIARASVNSIPARQPGARPHWIHFIRVVDAAKSAALATTLGGKVLLEPRPDRHGGKVALLADPQGAPFGLLEWTEADLKELVK
jgi:predicted enzyme related to lactoylglutathione lyase